MMDLCVSERVMPRRMHREACLDLRRAFVSKATRSSAGNSPVCSKASRCSCKDGEESALVDTALSAKKWGVGMGGSVPPAPAEGNT